MAAVDFAPRREGDDAVVFTLRFQVLLPQKANSVSLSRPPRHTPKSRLRSGIVVPFGRVQPEASCL